MYLGFEKFTERARRVLTLAQGEAQRFNHNYIGTEHLLLGLLKEGEGVALRVLNKLDIDISEVQNSIEESIGRAIEPVVGEIGLTPRAKKVIELAVGEARHLAHHYIGTEHLLLGLIREEEGIAATVLQNFGLSLEKVREQVIEELSRNTYTSSSTQYEPESLADTVPVAQTKPAEPTRLEKPSFKRIAQQLVSPGTDLPNIRSVLFLILTSIIEEKELAIAAQQEEATELTKLEEQLRERIKQARAAETRIPFLERIAQQLNTTASNIVNLQRLLLALKDYVNEVRSEAVKSGQKERVADLLYIVEHLQKQLDKVAEELKTKPDTTAERKISSVLTGLSLVERAREGKLDPLVGRESESERLLRILNRRYNPHALLVGGDGVGKSAIVHGLAAQIASTVPPLGLASTDIIWLDLNDFIKFVLDPDMVANLAGDETHSVILFVPHFDQLLEFALKENRLAVLYYVFSHLGVRLIATTTLQGYERLKHLESTIAYRFQVIQVSEPDEKTTLEILRGVKARYEQHYSVTVEDSALEIAQYLSQKYFPDRTQPSKALDLLDEACSLVSSRRRPETTEARDEKSGAFESLVTDYNLTEAVAEMTGKSIPDIRKELFS